MKRFIVASFGFLAIVALATSCASANTQTSGPPPTTPTARPSPTSNQTVPASSAGLPQYGGVLNCIVTADITTFDEVYGTHAGAHTLKLTNEELLRGDWTKGPAGTGQVDWAVRGIGRFDLEAGDLAESWKILGPGQAEYHIRHGVHFALSQNSEASRLVGGRELNADDVVYSLKRYLTEPRSYLYYSREDLRNTVITEPDKWTVVIKSPLSCAEESVRLLGDRASIIPHEVVEKYGNMNDPRVSVGTGPFILTDFVSYSSGTLVRNPKYWDTDPVGPGKGSPLPYLDGVKYLIIPDISTQLAAVRTAKADFFYDVFWEDARSLMQTTPQLQYKKVLSDGKSATFMKTDKAPFNDIRVRRALMMATDFQALNKDYAGGDGVILSWPITPLKEYINDYLALDNPEMPASVKELYVYSPDKAKALLTEAGFPSGFKTEVITSNVPTYTDYYAILKQMWAKVGVDLTITPKEATVFTNIQNARAYDNGMLLGSQGPSASLYSCQWGSGSGLMNASYISDPKIDAARAKMNELLFTDQAAADKVFRDLMKYVLDQAWVIPYTYAPYYHFWWPWLKNFHGEISVGYDNTFWFTKWAWIDKSLKEQMGH